jgi:hypothetical protein
MFLEKLPGAGRFLPLTLAAAAALSPSARRETSTAARDSLTLNFEPLTPLP